MNPFRVLTPLLACFFLAVPSRAADEKPAPKHVKAGVSCFDCHHEEKPTKAAADDSCIGCHGDGPAMAAFTKSLAVNPHATPKGGHPGPFLCTQCHFQHKPPVVKCLECHPKFKLTPK
ncbi:cytochrome c3 family protein [Mesoterricola silvestris]|uniref:Tetrahaem cytochrome domain-containing protein n=1 Tax=Mesoterricola silvestris TaxID=2927979 RepID=A0AA48GTT8_9BACT|nr:cytochrome c3 family protein [Mesoterricola silvestris]BDU74235.1 hypothetical protein METEAL_34090 [Mesoterricola silvestris]